MTTPGPFLGKDMKLQGVLFTVLASGKSRHVQLVSLKKISISGFSPQCHGRAGCLPVIAMQHVPLFLLNNWGQEEGATTACFYYLNEMVHDIKNLWPKSDVEAV